MMVDTTSNRLRQMKRLVYMLLLTPVIVSGAKGVGTGRNVRRNRREVFAVDHDVNRSNKRKSTRRKLLRKNEKQFYDTLDILGIDPESLLDAEFRTFDFDELEMSLSMSMSFSMPSSAAEAREPTRSPTTQSHSSSTTTTTTPARATTPPPAIVQVSSPPTPAPEPTSCECPEGLAIGQGTNTNTCYPPCPAGINGEQLIGIDNECFYECPEGFYLFMDVCFFDSVSPLQVQREEFETFNDCIMLFEDCDPCRANPLSPTSYHPPCPDGFDSTFSCATCILTSCPNGYTRTEDMDGCELPGPIDRSAGAVTLDCL